MAKHAYAEPLLFAFDYLSIIPVGWPLEQRWRVVMLQVARVCRSFRPRISPDYLPKECPRYIRSLRDTWCFGPMVCEKQEAISKLHNLDSSCVSHDLGGDVAAESRIPGTGQANWYVSVAPQCPFKLNHQHLGIRVRAQLVHGTSMCIASRCQ